MTKTFLLNLFLTTFIGFLLISTLPLYADAEADHNALRKLRTIFEETMNKGDYDQLAPYMAKDFSVILATGDEVKSIDELKAVWKKIHERIGANGSYTVKMDPDLSDLYGDIAVTHGKAYEHIRTSTGQEVDLQTYWMAIAHREKEGWKFFRAQSTMDPFNNPVIDIIQKTKRLMFGLGGLVFGILIGFIVCLMRRRQTT